MKSQRGGFQPISREQLLQGFVHDSYKAGRKLRDAADEPPDGDRLSTVVWAHEHNNPGFETQGRRMLCDLRAGRTPV